MKKTLDLGEYHRNREAHCRSLAEQSTDPDIRRRHEQLADLHADQLSRLSTDDTRGAVDPVEAV